MVDKRVRKRKVMQKRSKHKTLTPERGIGRRSYRSSSSTLPILVSPVEALTILNKGLWARWSKNAVKGLLPTSGKEHSPL